MPRQHRLSLAALGLCLVGLAPGCDRSAADPIPKAAKQDCDRWNTIDQHWYKFIQEGTHNGWSTLQHRRNADTRCRKDRWHVIWRATPDSPAAHFGGIACFHETEDGQPLSARFVVLDDSEPMIHKWTFDEDHAHLTVTQYDHTFEYTYPMPDQSVLTPGRAKRNMLDKMNRGKAEFSWQELMVEDALHAISTHATRVDPDTPDVPGTEDRSITWRVEGHAPQGPFIEEIKVTPGGEITEYVLSCADGAWRYELTTRRRATSIPQSDDNQPPSVPYWEIRPEWGPQWPEQHDALTYTLTVEHGRMPEPPETSTQQLIDTGPRSATIRVTPNAHKPAAPEDRENQAYLRASPMINHEDPAIRRLARQAMLLPDHVSDKRKAERMRRHLHDVFQPRFAISTVSASEAIRTQRGACLEASFLLAAMLRAEGIPARIAIGFMHAHEYDHLDTPRAGRWAFSYHAWTQALLQDDDGNDIWYDLDASWPRRYHAGYITLHTTALEPDEYRFAVSDAGSELISQGLDIKVHGFDNEPESTDDLVGPQPQTSPVPGPG